MRPPQNKNEIDEIWNSEDKIKEKDLKYETNMYKQFEMIRSFGDDVYTSKKIKRNHRMDTIFVTSKNSKTSDLHRLLLHLSEKKTLIRSDKYVAVSNLSIHYTSKDTKNSIYQLWHRMNNLTYLTDHILY